MFGFKGTRWMVGQKKKKIDKIKRNLLLMKSGLAFFIIIILPIP